MASRKKPKTMPSAVDLIALGAGSSSSTNPLTSTSSMPKFGQKRPESTLPMNLAVKRPKVHTQVSVSKVANWEEKAITLPPSELIAELRRVDKDSIDPEEHIIKLLCGAAKLLRDPKNGMNGHFITSLIYIAKTRPLDFCGQIVVEAFSSLLKKDVIKSTQIKHRNIVPSLVINLFLNAFHDESSWPERFLFMFIEDSLGDRLWVDNEDCKDFVDILVATFKTKLPKKSLLQSTEIFNPKGDQGASGSALTLPAFLEEGDEASCSSNPSNYSDHSKDGVGSIFQIYSRYEEHEEELHKKVYNLIEAHLLQRSMDLSRGILRLLMCTSGLKSIRTLVAQRLEVWFSITKLCRPAQDLMLTVFINCTAEDTDTIAMLFKMKHKTKIIFNHFVLCSKSLINKDDDVSNIIMRNIFTSEVENPSNFQSSNSQIMIHYFQNQGDKATRFFAQFCFEKMLMLDGLVINKVRAFIRDLLRQMRNEHFNYEHFLSTIFTETELLVSKPQFPDALVYKTNIIQLVADTVVMIQFLMVTTAVRDSFNVKSFKKDVKRSFQNQIATIQAGAVKWIFKVAKQYYNSEKAIIADIVAKVVLHENFLKCFSSIDSWPPENERSQMINMLSHVPVYEATLVNVLNIFESDTFSLQGSSKVESVHFCYQLITRAAYIYDGDDKNPVIIVNDPKTIVNRLFENSMFTFPVENTAFPPDYCVPRFAMIDVYAKVWTIVVVLAAHNSGFGKEALKYPTFMTLIEMAITNNFVVQKSSQEMQYESREKLELFEFETFLGKNEITEANSYLLNHLIKLEPMSISRSPNPKALEDFKQECGRLRLGNFLCQSRDPDFLKLIIEKQKNLADNQNSQSSSMPWLTNLVEIYEDKYELLPVPALCQYLFGQIIEDLNGTTVLLDHKRKFEKRRKQIKLVGFFQTFAMKRSKSTQDCQLFEHLFSRLNSSNSLTRTLAFKTLHMIFTIPVIPYLEGLEENCQKPLVSEVNDSSWLQFVVFQNDQQAKFFLESIEKTLMVETDPKLIVDYIAYLASVGSGNITSVNIHMIACSFTSRQRLYDSIIVYSNQEEFRARFLNSMFKLFADYLLFLESQSSFPNFEDQVWMKINGKLISMTSPVFQTFLLLIPLAETFQSSQAGSIIFSRFLSGSKLPIVCRDLKMKKVYKFLSEKKDVWIVVKMLKSNTRSLIDIILSNLTLDFILQEIVFRHGMSTIAMESILKLLDSNASKVSSLVYDRNSLLQVFETQWSLGINAGKEFAKFNLNYRRPEVHEPMEVVPTETNSVNNRIVELSNSVLSEFFSTNEKPNFEHTLKFLRAFNKNISNDLIIQGNYNSIFNIICIQSHRRGNDLRMVVMPEITRIKKEFDSEKHLHGTVFYKVLQDFDVFMKNDEKPLPEDDVVEEESFSNWDNIKQDLIVDRSFKRNTDVIEKYKASFKEVLFHRQRPYIYSEMLLKTSTKSIWQCLEYFTDEKRFEALKKNPEAMSSILDFVELYYDSPKMILSLETIKSKKDQQLEDILAFDEKIIKKILEFVVLENCVESRINLVLKTCCVTPTKTAISRRLLKGMSSLNDVSVKKLQMRLYKKIPAFQQPENEKVDYFSDESNFLDKVGHHLISAVTFWESLQNVTDQRFEVWELTLIVMAKRHPYLIARQIPILADIFQGFVVTKSFDTFKERKMLKILSAVLDFLNTISARIKLSEADVNKITKILTFYQTLFHEHHRKGDQFNFDLAPLWDKFKRIIDTLIGWFLPFSEFGKWFIQEDFNKLDKIFNTQPFTIPERWFADYEKVEAIFKKRHKSEAEKQDFDLFKQFIERNMSQNSAAKKSSQLSLIEKVTASGGEKNLPIHEYIIRIKRLRIVPQIDDDIFKKIITSPGLVEWKYRNIMDILMVYFRYNDDRPKRGMALYFSMLDSQDEGVRNVAFQYLPQITLLQPEYRYSLIRRAFYRTLSRRMGAEEILMNTFSVINDSLF